jgi:hypothetical protein
MVRVIIILAKILIKKSEQKFWMIISAKNQRFVLSRPKLHALFSHEIQKDGVGAMLNEKLDWYGLTYRKLILSYLDQILQFHKI